MLISLRDKKQKLLVKDILDIDFDMSVEKADHQYYVAVNRNYRLDQAFEEESDAEQKMLEVAQIRNTLEEELKNY